MPNYSYFLIVQTAFLGDVILATALIEKIKKYYPDAKIDFLLKKGNEKLLNNNPHLNSVIIFNKKEKVKSIIDLIKQLRKNKYDVTINVNRFFSSGMLTAFSGAKEIIGFKQNPLSFLYTKKINHTFLGKHEVERNQMLIEHLTDSDFSKPKIYPSTIQEQSIKNYIVDNYITISPGSLWFTKKFPIPQWIKFINAVNTQTTIYLLGSKDENAECELILSIAKHPQIKNLSGKVGLIESAILFKYAKMNFCLDSAPLHIASAINAPTASIWCSTSTRFGYGPLADKSFVIETLLSCRPCTNHGKKECPLKHFNCGNNIATEKLLNTLK